MSSTPMMQQWKECKKEAKDAILLFRLGDFYEAFHEDAALLAKELNVTLTKRQGIPMSGVPAHAAESYMEKLVAKGHLVAIAEQIEDPKKTKGIVKRAVVRILSPGTMLSSNYLTESAHNYTLALSHKKGTFGIALLDVSTAECLALELHDPKDVHNELFRRKPSEILVSQKSLEVLGTAFEDLKKSFSFRLHILEEWQYDLETQENLLKNHFKTLSLDGFGLKGKEEAIRSLGALFTYVQDHLQISLNHIERIHVETLSGYMSIDHTTLRHLELIDPTHGNNPSHTLFQLINHTKTPMGARLLKHWLLSPLLSLEKIQKRQDVIEEFLANPALAHSLQDLLSQIRDLERLLSRINSGYTSPRDMSSLRNSLEQLPKIDECLSQLQHRIWEPLPDLSTLTETLRMAITEEPPLKLSDGNFIQSGYHEDLDELRFIKQNSQTYLAEYQTRLREETGIKTLKVAFNKAFGYSIEVSRGQSHRMPSSFHKRQTLVNTERFITDELKSYEEKILTAEERMIALEQELFQELRQKILARSQAIHSAADSLAQIDALLSLFQLANERNFSRPTLHEEMTLEIEEGRHPVIEAFLPSQTFIPNDTLMQDEKLLLLTGPNMAGKSTFIRQVALIAILAQMGSFVPAKRASLGLVDKLFSRIGASDDLARGQSTFMVEMAETANILNNATERSLVILDEIGRGTSTYDGMAIAWAVAEYLLKEKKSRTLFATHYSELMELEERFEAAINYNVAVKEDASEIVFLHKIVKGGTDRSYGIHVAKLAGLPLQVIHRAEKLQKQFEKEQPASSFQVQEEQLSLFAKQPHPHEKLAKALHEIDIDNLKPLEALVALANLQALSKDN